MNIKNFKLFSTRIPTDPNFSQTMLRIVIDDFLAREHRTSHLREIIQLHSSFHQT
jgi:hypothetical protein